MQLHRFVCSLHSLIFIRLAFIIEIKNYEQKKAIYLKYNIPNKNYKMARPENKTWGIGNHKLKFSPDSNQNVLVHDFKSKKVSTTVSRVDPHQASQLFKNKINFKAKKNTFDATHMDEILRSEFSRFATSNNFIRTFKKKPKVY